GALVQEPMRQGQLPALGLPEALGAAPLGPAGLGAALPDGTGALGALPSGAGAAAQERHGLGPPNAPGAAPLAPGAPARGGGRSDLCRPDLVGPGRARSGYRGHAPAPGCGAL